MEKTMNKTPNRIFLIGYMGSGKTTVSRILSDMTGAAWVDMDREIEKAEGMPIRTIFIKYGEHEFRNKEAELLDKLCHVTGTAEIMVGEDAETGKAAGAVGEGAPDRASGQSPIKTSKYAAFADRPEDLIVSCGGGIILDDLNRKILNRQYTIFLEADPKTLFERVNGDTDRPFAFMDVADEAVRRQKFLDLYKKREPLYKEAASVIIQTDGKTPEEIAGEILAAILPSGAPPALKG